MSRSEQAVFMNMCMITDREGNVLIQNRKNKNWPGETFPGGHVEQGESFVASVIREVGEETGLTVLNPVLCGVKQFFSKELGRCVIFFYHATEYTGSLQSSDEGEVYWVKRSELAKRNLAPDFLEMVEVMERQDLSEFYYKPSENNEWTIQLL